MDLITHKELKTLSPASRGRLGMVNFKIRNEEGEYTGMITGDSLREQLNKFNFDIIDLKSKKREEDN